MTATFPPPPTRAFVRADPRDVRETLALVIDAALVAAPRGAHVNVEVSANGGSKGGVVLATTVTAGAGTTAAVGLAAPLGALAVVAASAAAAAAGAAGASGGAGGAGYASSGLEGGSSGRSTWPAPLSPSEEPLSWGTMGETQSLRIARSLVEGAGGIFHVLPTLPPTVGRIEMWLPAGEPPVGEGGGSEEEEMSSAAAAAGGETRPSCTGSDGCSSPTSPRSRCCRTGCVSAWRPPRAPGTPSSTTRRRPSSTCSSSPTSSSASWSPPSWRASASATWWWARGS
mmetsp:Transcript_35846/g.88269  ORF Transcript_35846/g.88269 Transcript_35846/m.88269 type:complete len:285 (+) Transcript_35846:587-1441(+)